MGDLFSVWVWKQNGLQKAKTMLETQHLEDYGGQPSYNNPARVCVMVYSLVAKLSGIVYSQWIEK